MLGEPARIRGQSSSASIGGYAEEEREERAIRSELIARMMGPTHVCS